MASFNKVIVMGNLTRDPELKHLGSGSVVCEVGMAVNRKWFDKASQQSREEVSFIDVVMWGRTAEITEQYLSKGSSLLVEGRLQQDRWEDKESGQNRSKIKVICEKMTMVGSRDGEGGQQQGGGSGEQPQWAPAEAGQSGLAGAAGPDPDSIPF